MDHVCAGGNDKHGFVCVENVASEGIAVSHIA